MTTLLTPDIAETVTPILDTKEATSKTHISTPEQSEAASDITAPTPGEIAAVNAAQVSPEQLQQRLQLLGAITWLMLQSPLHRSYTIEMLEERILPSLMLNQFRYYEIEGQPVGFLNWAWLSEAVEAQFETGAYRLLPHEWQSGDRLWYPEFIAPFGHARYMVKDIRRNIFVKGTPAKALRVKANGTLRSIAKYTL